MANSEKNLSKKITEILINAAFPLIGVIIPLIIHIITFKPVLTEKIAERLLTMLVHYDNWQSEIISASIRNYVIYAVLFVICTTALSTFAVPLLITKLSNSKRNSGENNGKKENKLPGIIIPACLAITGFAVGYYAIVGSYNRTYTDAKLPLIKKEAITDLTPELEPINEKLKADGITEVITTAPIKSAITVISNREVSALQVESPDNVDAQTYETSGPVYVIYDAATLEQYKDSPKLRYSQKEIESANLNLYSYETISFLTDDELIADLSKLEGKKFTAYFVSMYDISEFDPKIVKGFTLWETFLSSRVMDKDDSLICLERYNDIILNSQKTEKYYFGVDPMIIWEMCGKDESAFEDYIDETINFPALANPQISFELLLPGYSVARDTTQDQAEETKEVYKKFTDILEENENIIIEYYGGEKWLLINPYLFAEGSDIRLNDDIMEDVINDLLLGFYQTDKVGLTQKVSDYLDAATEYTQNPPETGALSDTTVVIIGDSIFDQYRGSSNPTTVTENLTGASVINLAIGGASAARAVYMDEDPTTYSDIFRNELSDPADLKSQIESFGNEKTVFVIEIGLNDYFGGYNSVNSEDPFDEYSTSGAVHSAILRLKDMYPDSEIVIMIPGIVSVNDNGIYPAQEGGELLQAYRDTIKKTGEENNCHIFDIADILGETPENYMEFLKDGVHFNMYGRSLLGYKLADFLSQMRK